MCVTKNSRQERTKEEQNERRRKKKRRKKATSRARQQGSESRASSPKPPNQPDQTNQERSKQVEVSITQSAASSRLSSLRVVRFCRPQGEAQDAIVQRESTQKNNSQTRKNILPMLFMGRSADARSLQLPLPPGRRW